MDKKQVPIAPQYNVPPRKANRNRAGAPVTPEGLKFATEYWKWLGGKQPK